MTRHFIVFVYPQLLRLSLLTWLILLALNAKTLAGTLRGLAGRRTWIGLGAITAFALALRLWVIPHTHHLFYDELTHLDLARNLARNASFAVTLIGGTNGYDLLEAPPYWPAGFHTLLSLVYLACGYSEGAAYWMNAAIGGLTAPLLFAVSLLLWEDEAAALISALILAFLPLHLKLSGCADLSVSSFFWLATSLLAFLIHRRRKTGWTFALWLATMNFAAHIRPENILMMLLLAAWHVRERPSQRRPLVFLLLALAAMAAPLLALVDINILVALKVFGETWLGLWENLKSNLADNALYLLDPAPQGALLILSAWGYRTARSAKAESAFWLAFSGGYFLLYSSFWFGNFTHWHWPTISDRYSLALYLPLLAFAGLGLSRLAKLGSRPGTTAGVACACLLILSLASYGTMFDSPLDEQDRYRFLLESAGRLPKDAYVITYQPGAIITVARRPAINAYLILNERAAVEKALARQNGRPPEFVLFKDFWRYQPWRPTREIEQVLREDFDFRPLAERQINGGDFGFYRLVPRKTGPSRPKAGKAARKKAAFEPGERAPGRRTSQTQNRA